LFGLHFPNRIGLAAGFDKDARYMHELSTLGFGFLEIGTLTPKAQEGNPKPRLFRLAEDQALINRMGFNNGGVLAAVEHLKNRPKNMIIGGNIGKNKITPNETADEDYKTAFEQLFPYVDYFTVNVSSPNTPGLREL
jgi:dihydroorotate dehydrogenase